MSDIQLFRLTTGIATELSGYAATLEKTLQKLVESQMETLLGVRFLASEYATGKTHKGRIDSLGLDENGCPVIVEYKRHSNENVMNQGLYYLDWLLDHQAEFRWLVMEQLGKEVAGEINWSGTRLLCIASDFTRYDQYAVQQIPRNIELLRYKFFDNDLLLLELVNAQSVDDVTIIKPSESKVTPVMPGMPKQQSKDKTFEEQLAGALPTIKAIYIELETTVMAFGDDVSQRKLKLYTAFRRLKNFVCVVMYPNKLLLTVKLTPSTVVLEEGFSRDVSQIGHWGTGDLELTVRTPLDFKKAIPLLERSYTES